MDIELVSVLGQKVTLCLPLDYFKGKVGYRAEKSLRGSLYEQPSLELGVSYEGYWTGLDDRYISAIDLHIYIDKFPYPVDSYCMCKYTNLKQYVKKNDEFDGNYVSRLDVRKVVSFLENKIISLEGRLDTLRDI